MTVFGAHSCDTKRRIPFSKASINTAYCPLHCNTTQQAKYKGPAAIDSFLSFYKGLTKIYRSVFWVKKEITVERSIAIVPLQSQPLLSTIKCLNYT